MTHSAFGIECPFVQKSASSRIALGLLRVSRKASVAAHPVHYAAGARDGVKAGAYARKHLSGLGMSPGQLKDQAVNTMGRNMARHGRGGYARVTGNLTGYEVGAGGAAHYATGLRQGIAAPTRRTRMTVALVGPVGIGAGTAGAIKHKRAPAVGPGARRSMSKSAFGVEHAAVSKGMIRPDKTVDAAIAAAKKAKAIKPKPVQTPLADARFGPRIEKSGSSGGRIVGQRGDKRNTKYVAVSGAGQLLGRRAGYRAAGTNPSTIAATRRLHGSLMAMGGEPLTARSALRTGFSIHGSRTGLAGQAYGGAVAAAGYTAYRHRKGSPVVAKSGAHASAWPRDARSALGKSAFGIVHKGPLAAADDVALAPGKVKAVTGTVRPGVAVPAPASSPRRPLAQKLNAAVAATGGSQT